VLCGQLDGKPVKVYEATNPEHAVFIKHISQHPELSSMFPNVIELRGRFVVAEWIDGTILQKERHKQNFLDELVSLQCRLHQASISELPQPGFDYWRDFVWPRFAKAAELLKITDMASELRSRVENRTKAHSILLHPDLTANNVIRTSQKELKIVDNELLTCGDFALLDVCNTAYSLGNKQGQRYVQLYLGKTNTNLTGPEIDALQAAWLARRLGTAFVTGDIYLACELLNRYNSGKNILPFDFTIKQL